MSTNTILFGVLFLLAATCLFFIVRIELRLRNIFKGTRAANLESLIGEIVARVNALDDLSSVQSNGLESMSNRLKKHGRGVHLIRFNPFSDVGGNQSFAVGIVNEEGDGVVFSSLYSRDRHSIFAKPVIGGKSDIELTPEEENVILEAIKEASR